MILAAQRPAARVDTHPVMKKQTGFTLIELIITVTILGIMAAIAVPNYSSFINRNQQSSAYNNLVGMISLARLEAVKRSQVVTLCISSNQTTCDATTAEDWNAGWIVFSDLNGDGLVTTTSDTATSDTLFKVESAGAPGLTIKSNYGSRLSIAPRGRLRDQGTFVICEASAENEKGMALNLWVTGLGRQATDTDDDDIVEAIDGTPISCSSTSTTTSD